MNDIQLSYVEKGRGEHLVLLHGNSEDSSYFNNQIEFFSSFFTVIALDTRGHGNTDRGIKPLTLDQASDDLYDFLLEKGISTLNILGFSDGGNIALLFALKHPNMVKKMIINGANLYPMGLKPKILNEVINEWNIARKSGDRKREELLSLMVREPNIDPRKLKELKMPSLVIVGSNDMVREKHSRLIASSLPNGSFSIVDGSHFIAYENPDVFNSCVLGFLSK